MSVRRGTNTLLSIQRFFNPAGDSGLYCTRVPEQFEAVFDVLVVAAVRQVHGLRRGVANNEFIAYDVHFEDGVSEGFEASFCQLEIGPQCALRPVAQLECCRVPRPREVIQHAVVDVTRNPLACQQVHQVKVGLNVLNGFRQGQERHGSFVQRLAQVPGKNRDDAFCMGMVSHEQVIFDGGKDQLEAFGNLAQCRFGVRDAVQNGVKSVPFFQPVQLAFEKTQSLLKVLSGFCMQDVFNLASRDEHCDNADCTRRPRTEGPMC